MVDNRVFGSFGKPNKAGLLGVGLQRCFDGPGNELRSNVGP